MLTPDQFTAFFQAIHGSEPFPWQKRLLEEVITTDQWPQTLSLPTGAGKTAILDISVFALACGAKLPRRTVLVVDRRIVVDDAFRRARKIRNAVRDPKEPTLCEVHNALLALGGESPLEIALLRGGIYREDRWVRHPAQPLLVCSTVDQVGSRLLHQGYGVSPHMRSIHAGLLGNDALIILDEAHTSEPFRQTLAWIGKYRAVGSAVIAAPFAVVTMTATPRGTGPVFRLGAADRSHPVLSRRLEAAKTMRFAVAEKPKDDGLVAALVAQAAAAVQPGKTLLVVVNRVKVARAVAEALDKARQARKEPLSIESPLLITGRSRSLERDELLQSCSERLFSGRDREAVKDLPTLVVVATQCVEVGADLDADVLISEACPLDSLRQRLGRLDRLGVLGQSQAVLVACKELGEATPDKPWDDPVYGETTARAWHWILAQAEGEGANNAFAAGITAWETRLANLGVEALAALQTSAPDAPILFPAYCDLWAQTSPEPAAVPDPALFLHGLQHGEPEVQIVWRADLPEEHPETWLEIVSACPPVAGETLQVPLSQARKWLEGRPEAQDGSDLEGEVIPEEKATKEVPSSFRTPFLRWAGREAGGLGQTPRELRPGDTLVVPCAIGGCDAWGWAPNQTPCQPVRDLADRARAKARRTPVLRICAGLLDGLPAALHLPMEPSDAVLDGVDALVAQALAALDPSTAAPPELREMLRCLKEDPKREVTQHPSGSGWIITSTRRMSAELDELNTDDDSSSHLSREVALDQHLRDVGEVARSFAEALKLSHEIAEDLVLAARLHDSGKADPRFQSLLHKGDRFKAIKAGLLAKSSRMPLSLDAFKNATEKSGYPKGARHELLSMRLAEAQPAIRAMAHDWDLVLHLIASHHGRCRPFAPLVEDPAPRVVVMVWEGYTLSASSDGVVDGRGPGHIASGIADRFWLLVRRYGWWGLSYLEACLRLADHRASEQEEKGEKS